MRQNNTCYSNKKRVLKVVKRVMIGAAALAMVLGSSLTAFADRDSDLQDAQGRLDALQQQQADIQSAINGLAGERNDIQAYITRLDEQMNSIADEYAELIARADQCEEEIEEASAQIAENETQIEEQSAAMALRMQYMYENGSTGFLDLLFSSTSFGDFLTRSAYVAELVAYDRDQLSQFRNTVQALQTRRAELAELRTQLEESSEELAIQQQTINSLIEAKNEELEEFASQIGAYETELHSYDSDLNAASSQVAAIVAQIEAEQQAAAQQAAQQQAAQQQAAQQQQGQQGETPAAPPETQAPQPPQLIGTMTSGWTWPAPTCTRVTQGYGSGHNGIDIAHQNRSSTTGQPVVAACDGTVVLSAYSSSAGNWVAIYHGRDNNGNQVYSCYMHLNSRSVGVGTRVSMGQQIGTVGNTGQSFGAHLHFMIRLNSFNVGAATVNPRSYVG